VFFVIFYSPVQPSISPLLLSSSEPPSAPFTHHSPSIKSTPDIPIFFQFCRLVPVFFGPPRYWHPCAGCCLESFFFSNPTSFPVSLGFPFHFLEDQKVPKQPQRESFPSSESFVFCFFLSILVVFDLFNQTNRRFKWTKTPAPPSPAFFALYFFFSAPCTRLGGHGPPAVSTVLVLYQFFCLDVGFPFVFRRRTFSVAVPYIRFFFSLPPRRFHYLPFSFVEYSFRTTFLHCLLFSLSEP